MAVAHLCFYHFCCFESPIRRSFWNSFNSLWRFQATYCLVPFHKWSGTGGTDGTFLSRGISSANKNPLKISELTFKWIFCAKKATGDSRYMSPLWALCDKKIIDWNSVDYQQNHTCSTVLVSGIWALCEPIKWPSQTTHPLSQLVGYGCYTCSS